MSIRVRPRLAAVVAVLTASGVLVAPARPAVAAATWFVATTGSDTNTCQSAGAACRTIMAAIGRAASGDTVSVAAGTYTEILAVDRNVTLAGAGAGTTVVDAAAVNRVVTVPEGVTATISGMTVRNGSLAAATGDREGGGIYNAGALTLLGVTVAGNTTGGQGTDDGRGGGIYNRGTLTLRNSSVESNTVPDTAFTSSGGGIFNAGTVDAVDSGVLANNAQDGAGIHNSGSLTVTGSVVNYNGLANIGTFHNAGGGGIYASDATNPNVFTRLVRTSVISNAAVWGGGVGAAGTVSVEDSTIAYNSATSGGGLAFFRGAMTVHNSTVSDNVAVQGGAVYYASGPDVHDPLAIVHSTVSGNRADQGGGLYLGALNATTLRGTIVAGNSAGTGPDCSHAHAALVSGGHNLVGTRRDCTLTAAPTDQVGGPAAPIDPLLGPLDPNGGPTLTRALLDDSPALDNGPGQCPPADQRGTGRPFGPGCDIGSYESQAAPGPVDLIAERLEVTQGIQNLTNGVRLVAGKRTFVRFHVRSELDQRLVFAELRVRRGDEQVVLQPVNNGSRIRSQTAPDRAVLDHAFLFELPTEFTSGTVSLTAEVNPVVDWSRRVIEQSYANNERLATAVFETVQPLKVTLSGVGYGPKASTVYPQQLHFDRLADWLRRVYPVSEVVVGQKNFRIGGSLPGCHDVNKALRETFGTSLPGAYHNMRYYGLVDDAGGMMRGCSDTPSEFASGPAGALRWAWDTDGSYGDWYGGHELGHSYGLEHITGNTTTPVTNGCGGEANPDPSAPTGDISPVPTGDAAVFGFDSGIDGGGPQILPPWWVDMMTYCANQWIGEYSYEKLLDFLQNSLFDVPASGLIESRMLFVGGEMSGATVALDPLYVVPSAKFSVPAAGDHAIVLRDASGALLARHPFAPNRAADGDGASIYAQVPYVTGTRSVAIEGPAGQVLTTVTASAHTPSVTVTAPNSGTATGATTTVTWTASDVDNDALTYLVQYSPDGGATWQPAALPVTGTTSVAVDTRNLPASANARFRVLATDGFNTAVDATDGVYTVANRAPTVRISDPAGPRTVATGQTVGFEADATDVDTGSMTGSQLRWTSSIDGPLGTGRQLSVAGLSPGSHTVTVHADDGAGGTASDSVTVTVVGNPNLLPPVRNKLTVTPATLAFNPTTGPTQAPVTIGNQQVGTPVGWQATASAPWVKVSATSGTTPATVTVSVNPAQVPPGAQAATVTVTSPDVPGDTVTIPVGITGSAVGHPVTVGTGTPQSCTAAAFHTALVKARDTRAYQVDFDCGAAPHTIELAQTETITSDMEIDGGGKVTLSGGDKVRVFEMCLPARAGADDHSLILRGLTLTHGRSDANRAGGAITNYGCRVRVTDSHFVDNTAVFEAGAINNLFDGALRVEHSTFVGNRAATVGGAIAAHGGTVSVYDTLFRDNGAAGGAGGAIYGFPSAAVDVTGSAFVTNQASTRGGAVAVAGPATVVNSTFSGNTAPLGGTAVQNLSSPASLLTVSLTHVTVSGGPGAAVSGAAVLRNSVVSGSCEGNVTAPGPNLEFPGTSCHTTVTGQDPLLAAPADNGGPTPTMAIGDASPARDAADTATCRGAPVSATDQRGNARTGRCDLGAYER